MDPMQIYGACRVLYTQPFATSRRLREILMLDPGPTQYDNVPPWRDLGVSKTGWKINTEGHIAFHLAEIGFMPKDLRGGSFSIGFLWMSAGVPGGRYLTGALFDCVKLHKDSPLEIPRAGESMTFPFKLESANEMIELDEWREKI